MRGQDREMMNHDAIWIIPPKRGGKIGEGDSKKVENMRKVSNDKQTACKVAKRNDFLYLQKRVMENCPKSSCPYHKPKPTQNAYILIQFNILIIYLIKSMSTLRLQDDQSIDDDEIQAQLSESESSSQVRHGKAPGRPGRPRGKGRPRRVSKLAKKKSEQSEQWEERVKIRERVNPSKQQSSIEGYIKIIDYLKKIDYEEGNIQNKMNPYNALTATCFWYAVSAEYFSFDFFNRKNQHDVAMDILDRVHKIPLTLPNRVLKTPVGSQLLSFETKELNAAGKELSEKLNNLIPAPLASRPQVFERKPLLSTVTEDDQFISSTRAMLYNYISKKVKNSDKWGSLLSNFTKIVEELPDKEFQRPPVVSFEQQEEEKEANLFDLLKQQAKKKVQKKDKKKVKSENGNEIFEEDDKREDGIFRESDEEKQAENAEQKQPKENEMMEEEKSPENVENQHESQHMEEEIQEEHRLPEIEEENTQPIVKKYNEQDLLLDGILQLPIDKVISILQSSLPSVQLPEIKEDFMPIPTKDPLQFVFQLHPEEEQYLEYMKEYRKKKYREKVARSEVNLEEDERQGQYEDAKCQICTDGDYTEDNLIVFCSMCNISLHQRCVGLAKVPADSWVCDLCVAFGPAGINLPCPLCNVKGGAMKRTSIHIDINLFKETNPTYYEYSKKCPYSKQKEEYIPKEKIEGQEQNQDDIVKVVREKGEKQEECYYDYFVKSTYPTEIPVCHYVWVHYVCAIWVPECYFQEKNGIISIKGIENIDKKRFKYQCFVCKKNKCGAAVKCEDAECDKYYHPQCARKKRVYMEQLNLQKLKYLIFCEEHEPLKLTRQIQYKKKKSREEIIKFARMIEKYIETYRIAQFPFKLLKSAAPSTFIETVHKTEKDDHKERRTNIIGGSDEEFLKELMANLSKAKMMTVHLETVENGYKITNIQTPSKRQIRKCLNRYDQFWNSIKNGETNQENFKRYERIMLDNQKLREKLEYFLNGNLSIRSKNQEKKEKKVGKKRGKHAAQPVETLIEQEGGIFCVCKKPYEGETDMLECQVCCQWYHFKCLGFIGNEEDAQNMEFKCMKCMKFEENQAKEERLKKYSLLFSKDSILYNYRPPTPELMSQEEAEQKNYTEIMEEVKKSQDYFNASPSKHQNDDYFDSKREAYNEMKDSKEEPAQKKEIMPLKVEQVPQSNIQPEIQAPAPVPAAPQQQQQQQQQQVSLPEPIPAQQIMQPEEPAQQQKAPQ